MRIQNMIADAQGLVHRGMSLIRGKNFSDRVLTKRIWAQLGHCVAHSGSVQVEVRDGTAILRGPILKAELDRALKAVAKVQGIWHIENDLEVHDEPGNIPGLQGTGLRRKAGFELTKENWSLATRLIMGGLGAIFVLRGIRREGLFGVPLGLAGLAVFLRAITNLPFKRLTGTGGSKNYFVRRMKLWLTPQQH